MEGKEKNQSTGREHSPCRAQSGKDKADGAHRVGVLYTRSRNGCAIWKDGRPWAPLGNEWRLEKRDTLNDGSEQEHCICSVSEEVWGKDKIPI